MQSKEELESDILQPIPLEEWPLLKNLLKYDWPTNSQYYYWIENAIKWKKQEPDLDLQIYCPKGEYKDDLTFVGISSFGMTTVVIFTKETSGKTLRNALLKSKRFDWSKIVTFSGVEERFWPMVNYALAVHKISSGVKVLRDFPCRFYIKSAADCAKMVLKPRDFKRVPEECFLADLDSTHLPLINSKWPHRDKENPENSLNFLRLSVTLNKSIGLFLKEGDVLVSWALHNDWHGLECPQTLDAYKRKGYGEIVINALAKQLGENGISPTAWVACGNAHVENMFASLNWESFSLIRRITAKREDDALSRVHFLSSY